MKHEFPARPLTHAAGFTIVVLGVAGGAARAGQPWTYSIAAATSVPYEYRLDEHDFGSYPSSLAPGLSLSAAGARALTRHTSLVIEGGYRGYSQALGLVRIPETPPTTGTLRAEYFILGAGLRIEPWSDAARRAGPYAQILPAIFVSRWEESTVDHEGYDMLTGAWRARATHTDSFRSALPGIELSAGFRARIASVVGTDIALRMSRSADLGEHGLGRFSSGDFRGLDEVALVGGLTWSP